MSFLDDLIASAQGFLDDPPPPVERRAIETNSYDRADWQQILDESSTMRDHVEEMSETVNFAPDLLADLHAGLLKHSPRLRPEDEMAPTHLTNHEVMRQIMATPEMKVLRQHTVGDTYSAAMGMQAMQDKVVEAMETAVAAQTDAQRKADEAAKEAEDAQNDIKDWINAIDQSNANPGPPWDEEGLAAGLQGAMDQFDQAKKKQAEAQAEAQEAGNQAGQAVMPSIRRAAKEATEDMDKQKALLEAFGVEDGEVQRMSVKERMDLARKLKDNRLADFIALLGRFKSVQRAESRKRVVNAASEVHGVTVGNELTRMVAGEYLNFADPSLETLMLVRWAEHQLNQYDVRGKENMGQGPIVCIVDESGSMGATDVAGGTREAWSKALALSMLDQARHRKRDFIYIGFSSAGQQHMVEFPKGQSNLASVIQMTEHFFGGGTNYEQPLGMALAYIESHYDERGEERPDIVFISDDAYGRLDDTFMAEFDRVRNKTSIKVYGIALGCSSSGAMEQLSDNVREITELVSDPRNVGDLFRVI